MERGGYMTSTASPGNSSSNSNSSVSLTCLGLATPLSLDPPLSLAYTVDACRLALAPLLAAVLLALRPAPAPALAPQPRPQDNATPVRQSGRNTYWQCNYTEADGSQAVSYFSVKWRCDNKCTSQCCKQHDHRGINFIVDPNEVFENFVAACGRNYVDQAEEERRRDIFQRNVDIIRQVAGVKNIKGY